MTALVIGLVLAYLVGSVPFGLLLTRAMGLGDIRAIGSGNIGATNVLRTGNKKLAAAVLLLDGFKGFVAARWINAALILLLHNLGFTPEELGLLPLYDVAALFGFMALLGHIWPVWLGFKGGKGVATFLGALLALVPMLGLVFIVTWLGVFFKTRLSSLSALVGVVATFLAALCLLGTACYFVATTQPAWGLQVLNVLTPVCIFLFLANLLIFYTHRANIRRLRAGEEPRFGRKDPA